MVEIFFKSLIIGYSGAIMPGSLLTYAIDKSIKQGAKAGPLISIGHSILEFFLVLAILFGFGKYLGTELAKTVIGLIGGCVLGFFGVTMIRDVFMNKISINFDDNADSGKNNLLIAGAVISASNPYFIFWWAVIGLGLIMSAYNTFGIAGVALFYIGHILSDISWYSFISVIVSKTRNFISIKAYKGVILFLGLCLLGFGTSFIIGSVNYILKVI